MADQFKATDFEGDSIKVMQAYTSDQQVFVYSESPRDDVSVMVALTPKQARKFAKALKRAAKLVKGNDR